MVSVKSRDGVISTIYQAGMGQTAWGACLGIVARHVSARGITLDTYDFEDSAGTVLASNMAPDPAIIEYNEVYGRSNPLIERTHPELMQGRVFRASDFVPFAEFSRSELYNTVYRKLGIKHVNAVSIECDPKQTTHLSVIKPDDASDFTDRELARLKKLQQHIRQAYAGAQHLARTQNELQRLTDLWDVIEFAVLVVDAGMGIRFANRAAKETVRRTRKHPSRLLRNRPCLAGALRDVLEGGCGIRHAGSIELPSCPSLHATVFRLRSGEAVVLLSDPLRRPGIPATAIAERFGLTDAEARLARELALGASPRAAAEALGIRYETARSQLKNAMAKNGWRRQAEMLTDMYRELIPFGLDQPNEAEG